MRTLEDVVLWGFMVAAVITLGQSRPNTKLNLQSSSGLQSDCAGNLMRLLLDKALAVGSQLEVEAINGTQHIVLTPSLAAQCGYSMESDPWGNTRIYTSLMGCYVDNKEDTTFNVGLRLRLFNHQSPSKVASHDVSQTCSYSRWATREILCDRNYMEVSHHMATPAAQSKGQAQDDKDDANAIPGESGEAHGIWKMTFFTPEPVPMVLAEARQAGYTAMTTSARLVMRSPYNMAETYSEEVAGIPMEVFRVSAYYKAPHGLSVVNLAAACPTGGVLFTEDVISWYVPRRVTPLVDGTFKTLEMLMGINGQRLDKSQMTARGYTLSVTDFHIVIEIPVGSPDGYYKSHAPDYQYHITYSVEPMLEVLWKADDTQDETRYKVLFPITTPLMPRPPHVKDDTVPENRMFSVHLGTFLHDVELKNITFSTVVLTVEECNAGGFAVQEHRFPNGTKSFSLKVPFDANVVLKHNPEPLVTVYFLPLVFGFVLLPEETAFAHSVDLQASLQDVVLPTITGTCDQNVFYISVKYGNRGPDFQTLVGYQQLTPDLGEIYNTKVNDTHFSLVVPYTATDAAYELMTSDSIRARLDILLWDPNNNWVLSDLYLACSFPLKATECHPNGTMTAMAVKVESVPNLVPSMLTLKDQSCKPVFSNDRFAQFSFSVDSCGTTRMFFDNYMLYENEIGLYYNNKKGVAYTSPVDPDYRQKVSCYYVVNDTQTFSYNPGTISKEPAAEIGSGHLMVQMRLADDSSYEYYYQAEDYPVVSYLRQPLFFEVELMHSTDPQLALTLENCWATLHEDRTSLPSWDIIVDCRVAIPSHLKRFSMKMFTFTKGEDVLKEEIYVHCDAVVCDSNSQAEGSCRGQCVNPAGTSDSRYQGMKGVKRERRSTDLSKQRQISSGPIVLLNMQTSE
ncbi:putative zona pellucida sperm-binding protein 2-like [Scophthalmus maximus]|uniref:Putative zona pellucida sperm-binding protein 2-like n=1 Tax=Scophthalmus maximus TaxID=52904 RepID=A0A2U9CU80_SCOMX|nr:putative zona pellucida sperm-binding protein 2-like [Scophthalmus maximus]